MPGSPVTATIALRPASDRLTMLPSMPSSVARPTNGTSLCQRLATVAGAWAAAVLPARQTEPALRERYVLHLYPGDLDEGVKVLLTFRTAADRERQGPGFNRVKAYRTGVLSGPGACVDLKA